MPSTVAILRQLNMRGVNAERRSETNSTLMFGMDQMEIQVSGLVEVIESVRRYHSD